MRRGHRYCDRLLRARLVDEVPQLHSELAVTEPHGAAAAGLPRRLHQLDGGAHRRRNERKRVDGRSQRPFEAESMATVIATWHEEREDDLRPVNVFELHEHLVREHGYTRSSRRRRLLRGQRLRESPIFD